VAARLAALPAEPPFTCATALWVFDAGGGVQRLQHLLKYGDRPALGVALGRLLGEAAAETCSGVRYDAVVPVPLARARRLERGYNQSAGLAEGCAAVLPGRPPVRAALLARARPTRSQTALSRARRWTNVADAFAASASDLRGLRLLLVDDVLTTGATVTAAAQPLRAAGATVDLATFALAAV
jgi:ComF family protein